MILRASDVRAELRNGDVKELINGIFGIYTALNLAPETGEVQSEYAERLADRIGDVSERSASKILEYISKEEFGYGMTREEAAELSEYYRELLYAVYNGLGFFDRVNFRYLKRII